MKRRKEEPTIMQPNDADGNMTSDGTWTFTWNGENRLIQASNGGLTITFAYDYKGRLVKRTEGTSTELYAYDGWNRIAKFTGSGASATLDKTYLWRLDLSGTLQGAGGVGGLLKEGGLYPLYDANGNITQKVDSTGAVQMSVAYDPFGNLISGTPTGAYAFSTKPLDPTTQLYYYGYRWYDAELGRWLNRDPIEEQGGVNLYSMVGNDLVNYWDFLGYRRNDDSGSDRRNRRRRNPFGGHGSSGRFVRHYYFGGGAAVDLADWGLLGRFKNAPDVQRSVNEYKNSVEADALGQCSDGDETITATGNDTDVTDATGQIYSVGRSTFFRSYSCEVDCCNDSVESCTLSFSINDEFADPIDLGIELGGTPYPITASWDITHTP